MVPPRDRARARAARSARRDSGEKSTPTRIRSREPDKAPSFLARATSAGPRLAVAFRRRAEGVGSEEDTVGPNRPGRQMPMDQGGAEERSTEERVRAGLSMTPDRAD